MGRTKHVFLLAMGTLIGLVSVVACIPEQARLKPNAEVEAQLQRGRACARRGEYPEAIPCFEAAIALDPNCAEAYADLAHAQIAAGALEEAETTIFQLERFDGQDKVSRQLRSDLSLAQIRGPD